MEHLPGAFSRCQCSVSSAPGEGSSQMETEGSTPGENLTRLQADMSCSSHCSAVVTSAFLGAGRQDTLCIQAAVLPYCRASADSGPCSSPATACVYKLNFTLMCP